MRDLFSDAGLVARIPTAEESQEASWRKLVVNLCINPLTAAMGVSNGALAMEQWRPLINSLVREALASRNKPSSEEEIQKHVDEVVRTAEATKANRSSMLQDIQRGVSTEQDHLLWSAKQLGAEKDMPLQRFLAQLLLTKQVSNKV